MNKNISIIVLIIILIVIAGGIYFLFQNQKNIFPEQKQISSENNIAESQSDSLDSSEEGSLENSEQETQQETSSASYEIQGMKIEILKEGTGQTSKTGDVVFVHYVGTLKNGQKFDSSIDRGQPFSFTLGENMMIQGWELGVLGMKVGEKRKLTIPPELGYGNQGAGGVIPPVSTLIFEIELIGIN